MAWEAWRLDHLTWGWIAWIAFFVAWETYALIWHRGEELTAHLRPLWLEHPLTWCLALGLWLWIGLHFLAPSWEVGLVEMVTRPRG